MNNERIAKMNKSTRKRYFAELWQRAYTAGMQAGKEVGVEPMIVAEHESPLNDNSPIKKAYLVPDGACGFAWILVKPATGAFAKWAKEKGIMKPAYGGGVQYWVFEFNQSITRKEAFARAAVEVLQEGGIPAGYGSRLD